MKGRKVKIELPYPPSSNRYWRVWHGRMVVSSEARAYRKLAAALALAAGVRPLAGPVAVRLDVFRPARRGDLDNSLKVLLDSLRGVAYQDDSQIVSLTAVRHDDHNRGRVIVSIEPAARETSQSVLF